jgi:hypothetical protein
MSIIFENNDLLKVESRSVIPDYVSSFSEAALYVAEAINEDYNSLMESIGVEELAVFESTGMEIVYEGERLNSFKEKVIKFFQDAWKAIKGFFEKILGWFEQKRKESAKKLGAKISAADLSKLPDGTKLGKIGRYGDFEGVAKKISGKTDGFLKSVDSEFNKICRNYDELNKKRDYEKDERSGAHEAAKEAKEKIMGDIFKDTTGYHVNSMDELRKAINTDLYENDIEVDKSNIKYYLKEMIDVVIDGKVNKTIKEMYKASKKLIDDAISRAKKYDGSRVLTSKEEIVIYREALSINNAVKSTIMNLYKKQYAEYRIVLVKIYTKIGKIKATNESSETSIVDTQVSLVESILNF